MPLSNAERSKRYRERLKQKAAAGDTEAAKKIEKNKDLQLFRNAKNFVKNHATIKQARELRELTLDREKELKESKND